MQPDFCLYSSFFSSINLTICFFERILSVVKWKKGLKKVYQKNPENFQLSNSAGDGTSHAEHFWTRRTQVSVHWLIRSALWPDSATPALLRKVFIDIFNKNYYRLVFISNLLMLWWISATLFLFYKNLFNKGLSEKSEKFSIIDSWTYQHTLIYLQF